MITYEEALGASHFEHVTLKNADGTPVRCRRSGKTKTWKTRPGSFRIPVKHGLKDSFYIEYDAAMNAGYYGVRGNAAEWKVA
jgi:hypothetical protein